MDKLKIDIPLQEKIISLLHPECETIEEALENEIGDGCYVYCHYGQRWEVDGISMGGNYVCHTHAGKYVIKTTLKRKEIYRIEGRPITIGRLSEAARLLDNIIALRVTSNGLVEVMYDGIDYFSSFSSWRFIGDNGEELSLRDQEDVTRYELYQLFVKNV